MSEWMCFSGFAMDEAVFGPYQLPFLDRNWVSFERGVSFGSDSKKWNLFGFSLGGYRALTLADQFPDQVDRIVVLGIRPQYSSGQLRVVSSQIQRGSQAYLKMFYRACFESEKQWTWFLTELWPRYQIQDEARLLSQLDFLSKNSLAKISDHTLSKTVFFHGRDDQIAPLTELQAYSPVTPSQIRVLAGGHLPLWADLTHAFLGITR